MESPGLRLTEQLRHTADFFQKTFAVQKNRK